MRNTLILTADYYSPGKFHGYETNIPVALQWRHYEHGGVSNHRLHDCLLNGLFKHISKKTSMLCVTGLCVGNSPLTGEFPTQMVSNTESVSSWWRHHGFIFCLCASIYDLTNGRVKAPYLKYLYNSRVYSRRRKRSPMASSVKFYFQLISK